MFSWLLSKPKVDEPKKVQPKLSPAEVFKEEFGFNDPKAQAMLEYLQNIPCSGYQPSNFPETEEFHPYSCETNYEAP